MPGPCTTSHTISEFSSLPMLFIDLLDVVMREIGFALCQTGNARILCHFKPFCWAFFFPWKATSLFTLISPPAGFFSLQVSFDSLSTVCYFTHFTQACHVRMSGLLHLILDSSQPLFKAKEWYNIEVDLSITAPTKWLKSSKLPPSYSKKGSNVCCCESFWSYLLCTEKILSGLDWWPGSFLAWFFVFIWSCAIAVLCCALSAVM